MTGIAVGIAALVGVSLGWWGAAAVVAVVVIALALRRDIFTIAASAVVVFAALLGAWRVGNLPDLEYPDLSRVDLDAAMVVTAPVRSGQRQHFIAEVGRRGAPSMAAPPVRVCVTAAAFPPVQVGDVVQLRGGTRAAADLAIAVRAVMESRDCQGSMFAVSTRILESAASPARTLADVRSRLGDILRRAAPGDTGVLLSGLVTGDDAGFSPARQEAFIRTGTTHLTAVSGSNLALVVGILATVGAATFGRHRLPWQVVTIIGIWGYAMISGAQAPATRAAIVATAALLAFRFGRSPDFVTLILLAAGAMAMIDPGEIESLGFRLSVAASLALALVLPTSIHGGGEARVAVVLAAVVAAQIATLPILLPTFGTLSLASLPANAVAVPLVAVAMPTAALAGVAGLVWWPLGEAIAAPATLAASALIRLVDALGAPEGYVRIGSPPVEVAAAIAITGVLVLLVVSGDAQRGVSRCLGAVLKPGDEGNENARQRLGERAKPFVAGALPEATARPLPSASLLVFAGEDPPDAPGAHLHDAEDHPASKKEIHQIADNG